MKILVGVKRVVDYAVKVRVAKGTVDLANVKQSMNPFCEIAVEEAVRIKESQTKLNKNNTTDIIAISIGPKQCSETIRTALAMGCDRGIHILTDANVRTDYMDIQPDTISKILASIIEKENPQLILVGKQSIDSDCGHVGTYLGGLLNIPCISYAAKIDIATDTKSIQVERETDTGTETVSITKLPAIITCDLRLNEPRYASLPNIMKAKKKKIDTINASDLGIDLLPKYKVLEVLEPPTRSAGSKVTNVDDLLNKLRNEAKVL